MTRFITRFHSTSDHIRLIVMSLLISTAWLTQGIMPDGTLYARDYFVDNVQGDDAFNGRTPGYGEGSHDGPLRTINRALQMVVTGDTIILAKTDEPYREVLTFSGSRLSGETNYPLTLRGNGATLDGSRPVPDDAWEHVDGTIYRFHPRRVSHQQLFGEDKPLSRVVVSPGAELVPELEPMQWCLLGGYVYFCAEPYKRPEDYLLTHSALQTGITLFHVQDVHLVDLVVQGYQLDGINAFNSARGIVLDQVTSRGNGRSGLCVGGASDVLVDNCVIGDNGEAQVLTLPYSHVKVDRSRLLEDTAPGWLARGGTLTVVTPPNDAETTSNDPEQVPPGQ